MNCFRQCERLLTSILAFSLQQSGLSVPKSPTLYSFKDKSPRNKECLSPESCFQARAHPGSRPCGQHQVSPCEGYSLFLGTGLYGGPFLPWCTRQTRCPLPNTRWLKPARDRPHACLFSNPLPNKDRPSLSVGLKWSMNTMPRSDPFLTVKSAGPHGARLAWVLERAGGASPSGCSPALRGPDESKPQKPRQRAPWCPCRWGWAEVLTGQNFLSCPHRAGRPQTCVSLNRSASSKTSE